MNDTRPSICVVAHNAYGAVTGSSTGHIGGVERQTSVMVRWLAARGWPVSVITWQDGARGDEVMDAVRVLKLCRRNAGIRGVRFFCPRWTSLDAAMRRADAEIYYQNCGEYVTGQVALWCRMHGRKFVYSVADDPDCDPTLPLMRTVRERVLYRYGLRHADRVIAQTRKQQYALRSGFGIDSTVVPMPCAGPGTVNYAPIALPKAAKLLWVGRICPKKRPDRLISLARACPDLSFELVGPPDATGYGEGIVEGAKQLPNIAVRGPVPWEHMASCYRNSACLVCTSDFEGFPNTFLEAWSHGLPVVTTFDPDNLVAQRGLGVAAHDVPGLAAGIRDLLSSPQRWRQASENARRYYLENHTVESVMPKFERVFLDALGRPPITPVDAQPSEPAEREPASVA